MKKLVLAVPVLALALGGTTACATKKFVRGQVGEVNDKVESVSKSLEETQERTKANEAKIAEVDQRAQAAAQAADSKAVNAGQRADTAKTHGGRGDDQGRGGREGLQAPGLRSGPERGQGQLQVRQGGGARGRDGRARSAGRRS